MRGRRIITPILYRSYFHIYLVKKKSKFYFHTHIIFKKWKAHSTVFQYNININSNSQIPGGNFIIYEP